MQAARELLRLHWGYGDFRAGQAKVLENVFADQDTVVIMPTGGGKSLCYQLPSLVLDGITIVVSPLISLMKDQVDSLIRIGIPATFINSSLSQAEMTKRLEEVKSGAYKLLYIAPERFYSLSFLQALTNIKVSLFAIDEAHCISQWGHDFRPSYTRLRPVIDKLGKPIVLALTATATPEVREDIIAQLKLENPALVVTGFARPNLQFGVIEAKENQKPAYVLDTVRSFPDSAGIIYASTRSRVDELTQVLLENDIEAAAYHAGMDDNDRKWTQNNFIENKVKVIVATNAFGLGIDKPDVRFVIHYDMPGTVEAYYQEAGRAGRDGKPSVCLLLYNSRDRHLHEFFIKGDNPPPEIIREVYNILLSYETEVVMVTYAEISEMLMGSVPEMAIGTSIKILEKEAYVRKANDKTASAQIKLNAPYETVASSISPRAKKQAALFRALGEKYGSEIKSGKPINLESVAEVLDVKKESLLRLVRKLAEDKMLDYKPPFRGSEIRILRREDPRKLSIDYSGLKDKLRKAYDKLDKIEEYIYEWECRQKAILDYFGESGLRPCGRCDLCLGAKKGSRLPQKEYLSTDGPEEKEARKAQTISTKLTQLETLELFKKGNSIAQIAKKRELERDTVVDHIIYLYEKKILKKEELDRVLDDKTKKRLRKSIKKVGNERLKPIYEDLQAEVEYYKIKLYLALAKK